MTENTVTNNACIYNMQQEIIGEEVIHEEVQEADNGKSDIRIEIAKLQFSSALFNETQS